MRYIFPDKIEKTLFFMIRNFVIRNSVHKEFSALGTLLLRNFVIRNFVIRNFVIRNFVIRNFVPVPTNIPTWYPNVFTFCPVNSILKRVTCVPFSLLTGSVLHTVSSSQNMQLFCCSKPSGNGTILQYYNCTNVC